MANFYSELFKAFEARATLDCLRLVDGSAWSYADLSRAVDQVAQVLLASEVEPADRVVVQLEKSPLNLALYLAVLKVGAVYVPLNTAYTAAELDYFIADAQPKLFVAQDARDDVASLTLKAGAGTLVEALAETTVEAMPTIAREDADLAAILYTSGTTGRSKGAMLSHANLASNARRLCEVWGWQDDDVLLHALPIFHVHGLFIASHCALLRGTPMVFLPKFDAAQVLAALPSCTVMMGVPTFYTRLLAESDLATTDLSRLRVFICGSAPLTETTFTAWQEATGHRILERYGMSETIINTSNPLEGERVAGTVGYPLPDLQLRIADDNGGVVAPGDVGSIEVKGPSVFSGYWRMPEKTAAEFREDGFFITGDLGIQEEDGRVSIVGRSKDLVISGGYNVYPKEIERLLDELPEVEESAVIGVAHADFGEAVVAVVVARDAPVTLDVINDTLQSQLANFKRPKAVFNVAELPRNTMGKVQKNQLRDTYADTFMS